MSGIGPAGYAHIALFGIFLPYLAVKSARMLDARPFPPKAKHFVAIIVQLAIFGVFSALVARISWIVILPARAPSAKHWLLGAAVVTAMVVLMRPQWRKRVLKRSRRVWLFMPRTGRERALWTGCSLAAGISEEITYRGVLFALLWRLTGSALAAALLVASVFAVSHMLQGAKAAAIIFAISLAFQMLAWVSGSLYVGMAVHALYDILAGLHYGKYGRELDYPLEALPPPNAAPAPSA